MNKVIRVYLILIFNILNLNAIELNNLTFPYNSLKNLLEFKLDGWFHHINANNLDALIKKYNPKIFIEIGSWMGASATFIAKTTSEDCKVYAVDTWLGSIEHHKDSRFSGMLPTLFEQFLSNVIHLKLDHKIIPVRMPSQQAIKFLDVKPDMVYVDGSHEEEDAYKDIKGWYEKLNIGGIMCGDDWLWEKSVQKAIKKAAKELNQNITVEHNFWRFDPKK